MYYELYVDSLFVVNFVMNLYLLILVNQKLLRTATRRRLIGGAGAGALCYLLPFLMPLPAGIKYFLGMFAGTWLMIYISFHPGGIRGYFNIIKYLLGYSFLLGGVLLFVNSVLPMGGILKGIGALCLVGTIVVVVLRLVQEAEGQKRLESTCKVTLIKGDKILTVQGLIDSGNGLVEPISGKPVSVIGPEVFETLWEGEEALFRAIPYHSIDCKYGIMKGYLLPVLWIESDGITKCFQEVYVAVAGVGGNVPIIINPALFCENEKLKLERKQHDTESGVAGETAV